LTKEIVAETLGLKLVLDESILEELKQIFAKFKRPMTENNAKQAYIPEGAVALKNDRGTAPAVYIEVEDKHIVLLPGPPREMNYIFENELEVILKGKSDQRIVSKYINLFGIGESSAATLIDDLITDQTNPTIAIYAKIGQVSIRVTASAETEKEAEAIMKPTYELLCERLQEYIVSYDDNDMVSNVINELLKQDLKVSFAESCTGGLISKIFTDRNGISQIFDRGIVTYSNESKMDELGVNQETLMKFGAVSHETAKEMALGLYEKTKSDICVVVTGIAGPTGGTDEKPVGLVYIGVCFKGEVKTYENFFGGNRERVRTHTMLMAFHKILKLIEISPQAKKLS